MSGLDTRIFLASDFWGSAARVLVVLLYRLAALQAFDTGP